LSYEAIGAGPSTGDALRPRNPTLLFGLRSQYGLNATILYAQRREAEIALETRRRNFQVLEEDLVREVRRAYRRLTQAAHDHEIASRNAEVARLQARVSELQTGVENATEENRRLASAAEELKRSLADANQTIETIRAELKSNSGRMAQIESANAKLKEEASTAGQSAVQLKQTASDLEGLFRRREMYLNNILRRYREITEQYRAMSGVLASRRDREAAPVGSTEIAHIQNAIALAEEDLKQIDALTAQASRLEKKLPAK